MTNPVFESLSLPCGAVLPNRLVKAAMQENLCEQSQLPGEKLFRLYDNWSQGGVGLMLTGNVMIDGQAMTGPGGVVLEKNTPIAPFKRWAETAKQHGAHIWMQINHPGRQVKASMGGKALSPSDVALDMGKHSDKFAQPRAMTVAEIEDVIKRFASSAKKAQQAGFNGVQIHAAHGYLISQFLSPLTNLRTDEWGGSVENRMRILVRAIKAVRNVVSEDFAVGVKINSADFQRGGFDANEAAQVIENLNELPVDLVELSGGSYESPAMQGRAADGRTMEREAYFLQFARDLAKVANMPVMTTGGIRRLAVAEQVLAEGIDMVGMGTALSLVPNLPLLWKKDSQAHATPLSVNWKDKTMKSLAIQAIVRRQLYRLGKGQQPKQNASPLFSVIFDELRMKKLTKRYHKFRAQI